MIDLKEKGLPEAITVNGQTFSLETDFSVWLDFPDRIKRFSQGDQTGYSELFKGDVPVPVDCVLDALGRFYYVPREVPRLSGDDDPVIDYDIDADYIYAAFLQAYGIDLKEGNLHWHKFSALLAALPDETFMSQIIQRRSYKGNSKDAGYKEKMKLKDVWSLPVRITDEEKKAKEEFDNLFG